MTIRSRPSSAAYAEGWDRIFAKTVRKVKPKPGKRLTPVGRGTSLEDQVAEQFNDPVLRWSVKDLLTSVG